MLYTFYCIATLSCIREKTNTVMSLVNVRTGCIYVLVLIGESLYYIRTHTHFEILNLLFESLSIFVFYIFPFLFILNMGWYCGTGVYGLIRFTVDHSLPALQCLPLLIIIIIIIVNHF